MDAVQLLFRTSAARHDEATLGKVHGYPAARDRAPTVRAIDRAGATAPS